MMRSTLPLLPFVRRLAAALVVVTAVSLLSPAGMIPGLGATAVHAQPVLTPGGPAGGGAAQSRPMDAAAPQPTLRQEYPVWFGYLLMAVLGGGVLVASIIPSKRSHQD